MSAGIGGLTEVSPDAGGQIADGEPEGSDHYEWRLNGSSGPVVTSYWSFLDQAFIIPDGRLQRVLLVPIWNGASYTGECVSLQQGNLYVVYTPDTTTLIDTEVQSYATSSVGGIFDLTASGQVKQYSGSGTNWTALTGTNTVASALVAGSGGSLYMLASNNGGPNQVWQYSGSGTNWTPLTTTNTSVSAIAADAGGLLYVLSANIFGTPEYKVWKYSGSGTNWTAVTDTNTYPYVYAIAAANGSLYMVAPLLLGGSKQLWRYTGLGPEWTAVTGVNDGSVDAIVAAGDVLLALATLHVGGYTGISQCGPNPNNNMPLTGTITNPSEMVVQDGIEVYMRAANNGGPNRVWQYHDTPGNWTALTGLNTNVKSIRVSADNRLYMTAANDGGPFQDWIYNGTPLDWTVV